MWLQSVIFDNPILVKHVRSRLRRQNLYPAMALILIIAVLVMWACVKLEGMGNGVAFAIFTGMQGLLLFLGGTSQVASAVHHARESGTLDFHRVSPVSPVAVTVGFLIGGPIREWLLAATLLPFQLACVGWHNPGPLGFLATLIIMASCALLYHAIGVLAGVTVKGRNVSGVVVSIIVAFHLFGLARLTAVPTVAEAIGQAKGMQLSTAFYGIHVGHFLLSLIHQAPIFVFLFIASLRKIRHERAFPFAKPTAVVFSAVVAFYLLGNVTNWWGLVRQVSPDAAPVIVAYVMALAGVSLATAVTPDWGDIANGIRRARKAGLTNPPLWSDLATNWAPLTGFSLLVVAATVLGNVVTGAPAFQRDALLASAVAALAVFSFGSALQAFGLVFRKAAQAYFALMLFLTWILPLLIGFVAAITEAPERVMAMALAFSPLAGIAFAGIHEAQEDMPYILWVALGSQLVWAAVFLAFRVAAERKVRAV